MPEISKPPGSADPVTLLPTVVGLPPIVRMPLNCEADEMKITVMGGGSTYTPNSSMGFWRAQRSCL